MKKGWISGTDGREGSRLQGNGQSSGCGRVDNTGHGCGSGRGGGTPVEGERRKGSEGNCSIGGDYIF